MSWTITEQSKVSENQYMTARHPNPDSVSPGTPESISFIDIAGYSEGTINFSISVAPSSWASPGTLDIEIMGCIDTNNFIISTLVISNTPTNNNKTFYIGWAMPLEKVSLTIKNNATGQDITISDIKLIVESNGGGEQQSSSTGGSSIAPAPPIKSIQFNDGGVFGGASGALYDKTANTNTGQIQLANGSVSEPMLAFIDGTTNYDTGMYRKNPNEIGFSCNSSEIAAVLNSNSGDFIKGLNVGTPTGSPSANIGGIKRLSAIAANSWEDGNCGNSEFLYFSPTEFIPLTDPARTYPARIATTPIYLGGMAVRPVGNFAVVAQNGQEIIYVACKFIPKGFQISEGDILKIWCDLTTPLNARFGLFAQILEDGSDSSYKELVSAGTFEAINPMGTFTVSAFLPNILTSQTPFADTIIGDGKTFITLIFQPRQPLSGLTSGIMGARISMKRI